MNLVLDDAEEVYIEKEGKEVKPRQDLGQSYSLSSGHSLESPILVSAGYQLRGESRAVRSCKVVEALGDGISNGAMFRNMRRGSESVDVEGSILTGIGRILLKGDNITLIQAVGA